MTVKNKASAEQSEPSDDAFKRFQDLARKLIGVPKVEIDKAEKNEKRRKKRRAAKHG